MNTNAHESDHLALAERPDLITARFMVHEIYFVWGLGSQAPAAWRGSGRPGSVSQTARARCADGSLDFGWRVNSPRAFLLVEVSVVLTRAVTTKSWSRRRPLFSPALTRELMPCASKAAWAS